jgi:hypothetical protein
VGPRGPPRTHPGGSSLCGGTSRRYVGRYERVKAACPGHAICTGLGLERASTSYPGNRPDGLFRCSAPRPQAPCARDRRCDPDGERERQRRGAGLQGRVVAHELRDLRQQEQRSEEAEEASVTDTEAAVKRPLRNTCSGTIGSSRRSSQAANAASSGPRRRGCRASRRTSSRAPGPRRVVVAQAAEGLERRAAQPLRSESLITGERLPPGRSAALSTLCLGSRHDASPMCANRTAHPAGARSSPPFRAPAPSRAPTVLPDRHTGRRVAPLASPPLPLTATPMFALVPPTSDALTSRGIEAARGPLTRRAQTRTRGWATGAPPASPSARCAAARSARAQARLSRVLR